MKSETETPPLIPPLVTPDALNQILVEENRRLTLQNDELKEREQVAKRANDEMRAEVERIQKIGQDVEALFSPSEIGSEGGTWQVRIGRGVAALRAQLAALEAERENWRMSSVCREAKADLAARDALIGELRFALDYVFRNTCGLTARCREITRDLLDRTPKDAGAEVRKYRQDIEAAAGELLLPIPEPGTPMARMMIANRLLHAERDALRKQLAARDALLAEMRAGIEFAAECSEDPTNALRLNSLQERMNALLARTPADAGLDSLTAAKIASVKGRGFRKVGETLESADGKETCIVWGPAVRWLDRYEMFLVMHPPCSVEAQRLSYQSADAGASARTCIYHTDAERSAAGCPVCAGAEVERLRKERDDLMARKDRLVLECHQNKDEADALRAIFPQILAALGSGACAPDCSVEFLSGIPKEVLLVVGKLRAQLATAEAKLKREANLEARLAAVLVAADLVHERLKGYRDMAAWDGDDERAYVKYLHTRKGAAPSAQRGDAVDTTAPAETGIISRTEETDAEFARAVQAFTEPPHPDSVRLAAVVQAGNNMKTQFLAFRQVAGEKAPPITVIQWDEALDAAIDAARNGGAAPVKSGVSA